MWGFYVQQEITFFKRVTLIPGFRYDRYELDVGSQGGRQESEISPKVGLLVRATDWLKCPAELERSDGAACSGVG